MSYLADVKTEVLEFVDALREEIEKTGDLGDLAALFDDWKKILWPLVEGHLKQSYANGQKEGTGPSREKKAAGRFKNWRKERA